MKKKRALLHFALRVAVLFVCAGCVRKEQPSPPTVTQNPPASAEPARSLSAAQTAATKVATDAGAALVASWEGIKDYTYEKRADFSAGLGRMAAGLDDQIRALKAKRATMADGPAKDWDFAMKELDDARADLRFKLSELGKATSETWTEAKEKAAQAWKRTQDAAAKVKSSTTS